MHIKVKNFGALPHNVDSTVQDTLIAGCHYKQSLVISNLVLNFEFKKSRQRAMTFQYNFIINVREKFPLTWFITSKSSII